MKIHGTAKGGALSTKDFGVAFSEAGATYTLLWQTELTAGGDNTKDTNAFANIFKNNFGNFLNGPNLLIGPNSKRCEEIIF